MHFDEKGEEVEGEEESEVLEEKGGRESLRRRDGVDEGARSVEEGSLDSGVIVMSGD